MPLTLRDINKLLAGVELKMGMAISRGVVNLVNDSRKMQEMQITALSGEPLDEVERFQNYGLTSYPKAGAEAIVLSVNGHRSHAVAVAVDDKRYRLTGGQAGEVFLHDDQGQKIALYRDRIEVEAPKVVIKSTEARVESTTVVIQSDDVSLGATGGEKVARIGDKVLVGGVEGVIIEGSDKVTCA